MYIQITDRCNMTCKHCCYNCTANGEDMSLETWKAAKEFMEYYHRYVSIGGGGAYLTSFLLADPWGIHCYL